MMAGALSGAETLNAAHQTESFSCGKEPLDRFLKQHALANLRAGAAHTYVVCRGTRCVVGYYSLAASSVEPEAAPDRVSKGLARHAVPVMLLARLAVDVSEQGRGLGAALLKDALLRTAQVADIAGVRALLVHAKGDEALAWYERFDFERGPTDSRQLFLLIKDLRAALGD